MRISDWSSDVCSSDLLEICQVMRHRGGGNAATLRNLARHQTIGSRLHEHAENRQPCFVPQGLQGIDGPDLIALCPEKPRLRWTGHEAPVRPLSRYFRNTRNTRTIEKQWEQSRLG